MWTNMRVVYMDDGRDGEVSNTLGLYLYNDYGRQDIINRYKA